MMKRSVFLLAAVMAAIGVFGQKATTMREAFADKFLIGTALNTRQVVSRDKALQALIKDNFSAVVAENCMKAEVLQPQEGVFNFKDGDRLCDLAEKNGQVVTGHCLIWHSQAPRWFFTDKDGKTVSREVLVQRMKDHIYKVVRHYKGRVKGWDVVNEAIEGNGDFRKSRFYKIIGPDFIRLAFQFAHEADPEAELYYNDYGMDSPGKREGVVRLIKDLKAHGCRIDAVGMQSHVGFNTPLDEYEKSMDAFIAAGVKVMVTELDLSVLPWPKGNYGAAVETNFEYQKKIDPYKDGLPKAKAKEADDFYIKLFDIYLRHSKDLTRVTFWGVTDGDSWKNGFPVRGRTDYPLAFDRKMKPKGFVKTIVEMAQSDKYN
nr:MULTISPECIES: endo-1,4-beta-xylanase [Paraprevotella]